MSEVVKNVWFDGRDGRLLIGEAAVASRLNEGDPAVQPLGRLLCAKEFPYATGDFEQSIDTQGWDKETYISYGTWLCSLVEPETVGLTPEDRLTRTHITRMRTLGLGPTKYKIGQLFGDLSQYKEAIGIHTFRAYENWSLENFIAHAEEVSAVYGPRPSSESYVSFSHEHGGPSLYIIQKRIPRGINYLNEAIGYPHFQDWNDDEFVAWGANVMEANNDRALTSTLLITLADRSVGPSIKTIQNHFKRFSAFQARVEAARSAQQQTTKVHEATQMETIASLEDAALRDKLHALPLPERLAALGRYQVALSLIDSLSPREYRRLAFTPSSQFIETLRNKDPELTAGHIETVAVDLDIIDDIWPIKEKLLHRLHICEDELEYVRRRISAAARRHHYARQARAAA